MAVETARRAALIKTASLTALFGNLILAAVKIGVGYHAGSLAVVGDGIDSSVDVLIAIMSLAVARVISRPADREHPWGHGRAETIATALLSCILFFAGAQLILNSATDLIRGHSREVPAAPALFATFFSIVGKICLAGSQYLFGKKADSAMLRANAKNMAADVIISAGVLLGLGLAMISRIGAVDSLTAILVGLWVIRSAVEIFIEANTELMDGSSGQESYRAVFDAVRSVQGAGNPHRTRMRRIAGFWDIDIDIEVDPVLTVQEAHGIASRVEEAIKERVEGVYDIMVHVEPAGDSENNKNEGYGLREAEIEEPRR
ncbi:MAG: cation diffusion facilitator family transporter [Spirochaetaceae bacterium]|jgi:cation diffusion facilitator family transporter|nr:cation diffusion facilitator family transporter [Spirochaetaceae bacterium]